MFWERFGAMVFRGFRFEGFGVYWAVGFQGVSLLRVLGGSGLEVRV